MNRSPTIIIIIFLLSLLFGVFLVWPKYQELKAKRAVVIQKETELRNQNQYKTEINFLSEELKKYSSEVAKIDLALPSRFSLLSFLNYLQKTASENGLVLKNYSQSAPSSKGKEKEGGEEIKEVYLEMNLSGYYSSFKNLLSVLEKSSRLIEIEKVAVSSSGKEEPTDFNVGIKIYSY